MSQAPPSVTRFGPGPWDISPIAEGPHHVYQGAMPLTDHWRLLLETAAGLGKPLAVVTLREEPDVLPGNVAWPDGSALLWFQVPDLDGFPHRHAAWLRGLGSVLWVLAETGCVVYVHCAAGVNRSTMATAAYLMLSRGLTAADAIAYIGARREISVGPYPWCRELLAALEAGAR